MQHWLQKTCERTGMSEIWFDEQKSRVEEHTQKKKRKKERKEKANQESAVSMEMQMDKKIRTLRESYN
jgi:hypothetical protein